MIEASCPLAKSPAALVVIFSVRFFWARSVSWVRASIPGCWWKAAFPLGASSTLPPRWPSSSWNQLASVALIPSAYCSSRVTLEAKPSNSSHVSGSRATFSRLTISGRT